MLFIIPIINHIHMQKTGIIFSALIMGLACWVSGALAATSATLSLSSVSGDSIRIVAAGDPSQNIRLSYLPSGATTVSSISIGTTDASGNFTTTISSGGYGIPQGSPAYVTINSLQSATALWPSYSSSLVLSSNSANLAVGQNMNITASNALILASNGMNTVVGTSIVGSQLTLTGLTNGTGNLVLCGANAGCATIAVTVGGTAENQVSFSDNNFSVSGTTRKEVNIYGGAIDGYYIKSNTNPNVADISVRSRNNLLVIYAKDQTGVTTVNICSINTPTLCSNLIVTSLGINANTALTFSPNNVILNPGMTQNVTVSGGPDNSYYISSNSNSGVATAVISGNVVTLTGGANAGTNVISVCSTSQNATCGNLNVTVNLNTTAASASTLSFSQNVVSIGQTESTNVTVNGGSGDGYLISSNSNPNVATANIVNNSNIVSISGVSVGSAIVSVCSVMNGSVCSSIYVTVGAQLTGINFKPNPVTLTPSGRQLVVVSGGSGVGKTISSNSNPAAVSAFLNSDGTMLILTGNQVSGNATIVVCSATFSTNCASLTAFNDAPVATPAPATGNTITPPAPVVTIQAQNFADEAANLFNKVGYIQDMTLENQVKVSYTNALVKGKDISAAATDLITIFIAYGTPSTKIIGAGERSGVLNSYLKAYTHLPLTAADWTDLIKIANGRWPSQASATAIESGKAEFRKVYKRDADLNNPNDNAAVSIIAYGLRPTARNVNSEKSAIKSFRSVYGHNPVNALAWDVVRAIAYSGARR